jgi:hypothetical protein
LILSMAILGSCLGFTYREILSPVRVYPQVVDDETIILLDDDNQCGFQWNTTDGSVIDFSLSDGSEFVEDPPRMLQSTSRCKKNGVEID